MLVLEELIEAIWAVQREDRPAGRKHLATAMQWINAMSSPATLFYIADRWAKPQAPTRARSDHAQLSVGGTYVFCNNFQPVLRPPRIPV